MDQKPELVSVRSGNKPLARISDSKNWRARTSNKRPGEAFSPPGKHENIASSCRFPLNQQGKIEQILKKKEVGTLWSRYFAQSFLCQALLREKKKRPLRKKLWQNRFSKIAFRVQTASVCKPARINSQAKLARSPLLRANHWFVKLAFDIRGSTENKSSQTEPNK